MQKIFLMKLFRRHAVSSKKKIQIFQIKKKLQNRLVLVQFFSMICIIRELKMLFSIGINYWTLMVKQVLMFSILMQELQVFFVRLVKFQQYMITLYCLMMFRWLYWKKLPDIHRLLQMRLISWNLSLFPDMRLLWHRHLTNSIMIARLMWKMKMLNIQEQILLSL